MDGIMTWERRQAMATDQAPSHALIVQFVGAWLQRTLDCSTVEAHQQALHGFRDELAPWVLPTDLSTLRAQPFTLFDHLAFTPHGADDEEVSAALSPAGEVLFRAWLRQRGVDPILGSSEAGLWPTLP